MKRIILYWVVFALIGVLMFPSFQGNAQSNSNQLVFDTLIIYKHYGILMCIDTVNNDTAFYTSDGITGKYADLDSASIDTITGYLKGEADSALLADSAYWADSALYADSTGWADLLDGYNEDYFLDTLLTYWNFTDSLRALRAYLDSIMTDVNLTGHNIDSVGNVIVKDTMFADFIASDDSGNIEIINDIVTKGYIYTDRWLNSETNTFLGVGIGGSGNLSHGSGLEGWWNTCIGYYTGYALTTGRYHTLIGYGAGAKLTTPMSDVAVGAEALANATTAESVTALGYKAGNSITTGSFNSFGGYNCGALTTTGTRNHIWGYGGLGNNTTGSYNCGLGHRVLNCNTSGTYNLGFGHHAIYNNTTGTHNISIGVESSSTLITGSYNICIGDSSDVATSSTSHYLNIGNIIQGYMDTKKIGIDTNSPAYTLHVNGIVKAESGLIINNGDTLTKTATIGSFKAFIFGTDTFWLASDTLDL